MKRRNLLIAIAVVWGFSAVVATAWAFWTGSGLGTGGAATGSMNAPTSVTATQPNPSLRTVHVTWVIPTTPDNSAPSGFTVARSDGTTTSAACGTGTTPLPGSAINCDDTNVPSGTYTYKVTMKWNSWTSTSSPSSSVTVAAGALHHLTVAPSTSTPTAGTQFSVTVTAVDQYGSTFTGYTGSQCVTFSGPSTSPAPASTAPAYPAGGSGCSSPNSLVTFSSGVGTPNVTLYNAQSTTLTVTDVATSKTGTSSSLTVSPAGINRFVVSPSTTTPTAGTSFTVTLSAHDAYDNVATSYTGATAKTITWSTLGTSPAPSSTPPQYPTSSVNFTNGNSTTTLTAIAYAAGANTLTATDSSISKSGSASLTVSAASASRFVVSTPSTQTAGTAFNLSVTAHDAYDNTASSYTGAQTLSFSGAANAPNGQTPSYPASVTFTAGAGTASVTLYKAESPTLTVTQSTISGVTGSFTVNPGASNNLAFTTQPTTATSTNTISPSPAVTVRDAYNNPVTTDTSNVTVAIGTNPGSGTLSGTKTVAASAGVATFSTLSIEKAGTGYTLVATDGSLTSATSSTFNINPGAATKLAFTTQPSGALGPGAGGGKNIAFPVQPVVTVQDASGNTVTSSSAAVTLAIGTNPPGNGTLTCSTNTVTASAGVASFSGCAINQLGYGYTLTATSGSLASATSNPFSVSKTATKLVFTTQPGGGVNGSAWSQQPVVAAEDATGVVTAYPASNVALAMGTNPNGATLSCNANSVNTSYGVATFSGCSLDKIGTTYTLTATSTGLTTATSTAFTVTGPATKLVFTQVPASGTVAPNAFATQPAVTVEDASGNTVPGYTTPVTLAITSGTGQAGAVLTCTTNPVTPSSGVATFAGCAIDRWGNGYTLTATSGSLTAGVSTSFDVYAFAPSLSLNNKASGAAGKPEAGDTIVITYPDPMSASAFCGGQSGSFNLSSNVTVTFTNSGGDKITGITDATDCTGTSGFGAPTTGIGTVTLGTTNKYFKVASGSFTGGQASWNSSTNTMTILLGTLSGPAGNVGTGTSTTATYAPDASLSVPASAVPIAAATKVQF